MCAMQANSCFSVNFNLKCMLALPCIADLIKKIPYPFRSKSYLSLAPFWGWSTKLTCQSVYVMINKDCDLFPQIAREKQSNLISSHTPFIVSYPPLPLNRKIMTYIESLACAPEIIDATHHNLLSFIGDKLNYQIPMLIIEKYNCILVSCF